MTENDTNQPTPEQIERHFSAMNDSVNLINYLNERTSLSDEDKVTLIRNKDHLTIMLEKDFISLDPRDKKIYIDAAK